MPTQRTSCDVADAFTAALTRRYDELNADPQEAPTALHGSCLRNAYVLAETLTEYGFDPIIVCGGYADTPVDPAANPRSTLPKTITECRDRSNIHYWVEVCSHRLTVDLAAELPPGHSRQGRP